MKFIQLLTSAYVNGRLRHTDEGVLHLEDDEADRLISTGCGRDVTDDFSAKQQKETPVETLAAASTHDRAAVSIDPAPHQTEIAPEAPAAEVDTTQADAAAAPKED